MKARRGPAAGRRSVATTLLLAAAAALLSLAVPASPFQVRLPGRSIRRRPPADAQPARSADDGGASSIGGAMATTSAADVNEDVPPRIARLAFVSGSAPSGYGRTSPSPDPSWSTVAAQLARRLPNFAGRTPDGRDAIEAKAVDAAELRPDDLKNTDVAIVLGVCTDEEEGRLADAVAAAAGGPSSLLAVLADPTCGERTVGRRYAGRYRADSALDGAVAGLIPWSSAATGRRLLSKVDTLLGRKSTEDHIFAALIAVHSLVAPIDAVKSDINPSWEKGPVRNAQEFAKMVQCCRPQIVAALTDPQTKEAIDLLNAVDLRDQVGSYRVIVSNETPELEDFTLCILQQNDCFGCDAPILDRPRVPVLTEWRGNPLDDAAARQIFVGHLDHPDANPDCSLRKGWSWKIVVGANPAYDAFPMQHQTFYPSGGPGKGGKSSALWYDPVFCVETLRGDLVWCKRHYRCVPRRHWSADDAGLERAATTPGAWTLTTLDNGMVSEEKWTTVDAADDLSWAVLHYSGAARRAGQSYVGALLCSPDGSWPEGCRSGPGLERIREAFRKCDLELWELFGGSTERSYMWSDEFVSWAEENPPPLDRIGDISITSWRKREREKELKAKGAG